MKLTPKGVAFVLSAEGMVLEAYKDSVGVWTWAGGVTNASGHEVYPRYLDKPQTLEKCLEVTVWLMRERYLPAVARAFAGCELNEAQVAAALSFHWNSGAIGVADWVKDFKAGKPTSAKAAIMNYRKPASIIPRREMERDLFFDGKWPSDLRCPLYEVAKPSHTPRWASRKMVDVLPALEALGGWV